MKLPLQSIRWRIQAWHGLLLLLVLAGFGAVAYQLQGRSESAHLDSELQLRASALLGNIAHQPGSRPPPGRFEDDGPPSPPQEPPPDANPRHAPLPGSFRLRPELEPLFAARNGRPFYYVLWIRTGEIFGTSPNAPRGLEMPARSGAGISFRTRAGTREAFIFTPPGECLLVGVSEAGLAHGMARFAGWMAAIGALVLALGLAGGWWLASRAIAPIDAISAAAARIADGRLGERIPVAGTGNELDRLAAVLNDTFARLDAAFTEQARFTSDAAHELRTPVSVILAQTQLALARPRGAEEYRDSIETTRRAALRMQSLIESLLKLAQLDARAEPLLRQPCDLAEIAREQIRIMRPLANARGIVLREQLFPAPCAADPDRIAQIFVNLLSNAVQYSDVGGEVRLSSARENGHVLLAVSDSGPGISGRHLPHVFERFYRADASRNRTSGGAGLGLAICKTLAEAHGGTIEVASVEAQGSTFTLRLPADETHV